MLGDLRGISLKQLRRSVHVLRVSFLVRRDWRVDVVVGQVKQEGSIGVTLLQKRNRFLRQPLGQVLVIPLGLQCRIRPGCVIATGRRALRIASDVEIESLICGPMSFVAQVPLAGKKSLILFLFH